MPGMKLDDAYFKIMTDAKFRVGVCVRPQHFVLREDGSAQQVNLEKDAIEPELIRKMKFAHDRWGATLFYVDSMVDAKGATLEAGIAQKLQRATSRFSHHSRAEHSEVLRLHRAIPNISLPR